MRRRSRCPDGATPSRRRPMAYIMTTAGSTGCAHTGAATLTSGSKLTIGGQSVLLAGDVGSWAINGCTQKDTSKEQLECKLFVNFTGQSSKLKVGGQAVVLDLFSAETNGKPEKSSAPAGAGQSTFSWW